MSYTIVRTLYNGMAVLHPLYCPDLAPFLFWKLKLALKGRICGDINKNSLLLYAVQTVEKMVHIIRDRALKECPLCRGQYGCWSATSIENLFMM